MALLAKLELLALSQRGHLFPWAPVALAAGIGAYFAQANEPPLLLLTVFGGFAALLLLPLLFRRTLLAPYVWLLCFGLAGFAWAGAKAHWVSGPKLEWRYYGAVEGRIIKLDRSSSGALRIMLDEVRLERLAPERTPRRVRVALHGRAAQEAAPIAGSRVMLTAHLAPPGGPVEPGGFDFQRHAWFLKLGAVGYTRAPVMVAKEADKSLQIARARYALADYVRSKIGGEAGAFAAAIMTGDRSGMSPQTVENLRITNLAHLLAISGLHMGLLSGFVYGLVRYGVLLLGGLRHRIPMRKTAAVVALAASFGYLLLSGGSVATERAFIMATVALGAVFFERRVFSLRSVGLAALIVLIMRPEALLGPGFQMSFAATTALVSVFSLLRHWKLGLGPNWVKPFSTVLISSCVAGLATAPIAAAHFNHIAHYGLLANLAAVPLMGLLVIPAAVSAMLLSPIGLSSLGFAAMELGVRWILWVAGYFASLDGARGGVVAPEPIVLLLIASGMLFLMLWQGRFRLVGLLPVLVGFALWSATERPDVLISADGKLVGVLSKQGRALSAERGSGFVAKGWLENDGSWATQAEAAKLWGRVQSSQEANIKHIRRAKDLGAADCKAGEILVSFKAFERQMPCTVFDPSTLKESGAVALYFAGNALKQKTAREVAGRRLWNTKERDQ